MKIATKATAGIASYAAMLVTITALASTFTFAQSAHATSLLDRVQQLLSGKQQTAGRDTTSAASDTTKLKLIISSGDREIARRLQSLSRLSTEITSAAHLTASSKTALQNEVNSAVSGLNTLKTKLDNDKTVSSAKADAQSIMNEYRVYALIVPKVHLIKLADDIQATDGKLSDLANKLQTRIATEKTSGKDVSALESKLTDMNAQIAAGQNIAGNVETKIIGLQPSDYNSDHKILAGYSAKLKAARTDNQAAYADAKAIIDTLKTL